MNSCDYYQELISRLVDGEISHDEHEALMAHLNTCSRCNAMYAVFHDLSDILAEESEPLPEGLHENIMAGVRRSEIIRKNRRLRKLGLRTALTAAACAVLVLFAAVGITPGERAKSVSIRSEEELQTLPTPVPDGFRTAQTAAPAAYAPPTEAAAPAARAPVSTAAPDAWSAAEDEAQYTAPQPTQYVYAQPVQTPEPVIYQTPEPVIYQTPEPMVYQTPEPMVYQTPEPMVYQTPEPMVYQTPEPMVYQTPEPIVYQTPEPVVYQTPELSQAQTFDAPPLMQRAAPSALPEASAETVAETAESYEEEAAVFSSFGEENGAPDAGPLGLSASKTADMNEAEYSSPADFTMMDSASFAAAQPEPPANPEPVPALTKEESVIVRGKESRSRLLAMIGQNEEALPTEAELTRVVHVSLLPDDEYASGEKMDINIYGDFVFCRLFPADGSSKTYRADCSLKSLDDFLKACAAAEVSATPAPTLDPFAAEAPKL